MGTYGFSVLDYLVFVAVLVLSSGIGVFYAWRSKRENSSNEEFLVGRRDMSVAPLVLSMTASVLSAITVLGTPAEIFQHSSQFWVSVFAIIVAAVVTDRVFLAMYYELGFTSINKYLQRRSRSNSIRLVTTISYIIGTLFYLGAVLYGPALALSSVTPMDLDVSIVTVGIVCTFYTSFGGMKAVVWTDVMQMIIMYAGLLMVAIRGSYLVGGFENVWRIANERDRLQFFSMKIDVETGVPTIWEILLGFMVLWTGTFATNQLCVQRYCSVPSIKKARLLLYCSIPAVMLTVTTASFCGLVLFANYHNCDPFLSGEITSVDQYMPYFVVQYFESFPGLPGLFVAAVFSGSLSSISSALNAMTALAWDDLLKRFIKTKNDSVEMWIVKIIGIAFGLVSIALAFLAKRMGSILQTNFTLAGSIKGPLLGVFLTSALCKFANAKGLVTGLISGQLCCLILNIFSMVIPRPSKRLYSSLDNCEEISFNSTGWSSSTGKPNTNPTSDLYWFHYVSPFMIPFIGNVVTIFVTLLVSKLTGGNNGVPFDAKYLSPLLGQKTSKIRNPETISLKA